MKKFTAVLVIMAALAFLVIPAKATAATLDKAMVLITFDDGLASHYATAYPIRHSSDRVCRHQLYW